MERPEIKINPYEFMSLSEVKTERKKSIRDLLIIGPTSAYLLFDFVKDIVNEGLAYNLRSADSLYHGIIGLLGISLSVWLGAEFKNINSELKKRKLK